MSEWGLETTYSRCVCTSEGKRFDCATHGQACEAVRLHNAEIAALTTRLKEVEKKLSDLQEIVPEEEPNYYCFECKESIVPTSDIRCDHCGSFVGGSTDFLIALQAALYLVDVK